MTLHSEFFVAYDVFDTNVVQTGVLIKVWLGYAHPPGSAEHCFALSEKLQTCAWGCSTCLPCSGRST